MSLQWIESLEEHIAQVIETEALDEVQAWEEILDMAKDNLSAAGGDYD